MPVDDGTSETLSSRSPLATILLLPHELLQSILSSIANFEPWTYSSSPELADTSITDDDLLLYTRGSMPLNLHSVNRHNLGLSSERSWLVLTLLRHSHHLSRSDKVGISSAITQALRRANARHERMHWAERDANSILSIHEERNAIRLLEDLANPSNALANDDARSQSSGDNSMKQYHAGVQTEDEAYSGENILARPVRAVPSSAAKTSSATALIVYDPVPVLKLTGWDIAQLASGQEPSDVMEQVAALLVAVLITLAQCRLSLLEIFETLERDTPIPSIERCDSRDFATPKTSPRLDRPRSLSGSTIAEAIPHGETLSFSAIWAIYDSDDDPQEAKWVEERASEEKGTGTPPKRPKLNEYKQVSSGRVATLMDRFEKFHI
mgnify:CR=1 FL=1